MRRSLVLIVLAAAIAAATAATAADAGTSMDARIAAVQITMRSRLLYRGPVTGIVDQRTSAAIAILQQRLGVTADGIFGPQTLARLFP